MSDYKLYPLDGTGKIAAGEWIDAKNDDEAVILARRTKISCRCELWYGDRLIATISDHALTH